MCWRRKRRARIWWRSASGKGWRPLAICSGWSPRSYIAASRRCASCNPVPRPPSSDPPQSSRTFRVQGGARTKAVLDLEFHQLELRYEGLRVRRPAAERRLLSSLAERGQQVPIVVVAASEPGRFVVIDGYKRVRALRLLRR